MLKRTILLSVVAYAGAVSLRGEGVEEVGEQMEHFAPEEVYVDRRRLVATDDEEARVMMEEYFDEFPGQDIVGFDVEDEDQMYVTQFIEDADEEDLYDDIQEPDQDQLGMIVDEDGNEMTEVAVEEPASKEYSPDPESVTLVDTDLMGEAVDQRDRREAACGNNKSEYIITLKTDNYAYESKWKLINLQGNQVLAKGPPSGSNYADKSTYSGRWCLPPGQYKFQMEDKGLDGICSNNGSFGCGFLMLKLNGQSAGRMVNDKSNWRFKDFPFVVGISSRIDGVGNGGGNNSNGQWCAKVKSLTNDITKRGQCTLPNGQRGHRVRVTTKVDKYGKETSWKIVKKNGNGSVIKMSMKPIIESDRTKSVEDCLPAGDYNLRFEDPDGICCRHGDGFFKLIVNGEELLSGGSFVKAIDHDFKLGFDWINSMSERDCEWWWAHDYRRRDWHTRCFQGQYCQKSYRHLKWSPALQADARVYARKLLDTCDDNGIKHDATDQGENLAKNKGSGNWGALYSADKVTKRFVDNEEFWGWNRNAHLTQAMWYPSRYMGCAETVKSMGGGKMCRMQVCRYAKAGNCMMGKYSADQNNNWMKPMMNDDSPCGPMCASRDGCYH